MREAFSPNDALVRSVRLVQRHERQQVGTLSPPRFSRSPLYRRRTDNSYPRDYSSSPNPFHDSNAAAYGAGEYGAGGYGCKSNSILGHGWKRF
jgi:hypothetical protein